MDEVKYVFFRQKSEPGSFFCGERFNHGRLRSRSRKSYDTSGIAACAEYQSARLRKPGTPDLENKRPRVVAYLKASAEPTVNQSSISSSKQRPLRSNIRNGIYANGFGKDCGDNVGHPQPRPPVLRQACVTVFQAGLTRDSSLDVDEF